MTAKSFTKKPVTIEAMYLTLESMADVKVWCGANYYSRPPMREVTGLIICTLEGNMVAELGDWIIKGIKGEFYPCKPDIFEATYANDEGVELQNMRNAEAVSIQAEVMHTTFKNMTELVTPAGIDIHQEVKDYEWRHDNGGGYTPNETEQAMLEDFGNHLFGLLGQPKAPLTPEEIAFANEKAIAEGLVSPITNGQYDWGDVFSTPVVSVAEFIEQHMQSPEPETNTWALVADVEEGTIIQVYGIPCIGVNGSKHIVYRNQEGDLFLDCSDGEHTLDGQIEDDHYVGIRLAN